MKKLLSLLSVLTISGTAVPTTIAASPYEKQKNKLETSEINYSQTNNLEKLNRIKRDYQERRIEKWYKFLSSDLLKVRLSIEEAKLINTYFQEKVKKDFIENVKKIIKSLPKIDHSGFLGKIGEVDYDIICNGIWEKYNEFHEVLSNLINNKLENGITFVINANGSYQDNCIVFITGDNYCDSY